MLKKCLKCQKGFSIKPSQLKIKGGGKYCSKACMYNRSKVLKICLACTKEFKVPPVRRNTAKYCSTRCQHAHQMKKKLNLVICAECSRGFTIAVSHAARNKNTFCSRSCNAVFNSRLRDISAERNPHWKGGITPVHRAIRASSKYARWRIAVFTRDAFTCQGCFTQGGKLNADHIKPFSQFPDLIFSLDNGRTLCVPCHRKTDTYGWRAASL